MAKQAVGIIETKGLVSLIEASDAALKAADISMLGWAKIGGGMVTGFYTGDVAAVKAGIDAGNRRCCRTLTGMDSRCESMRLDRPHEQAITRPLPNDELAQLHVFSAQARVASDLVGQGHDLVRAA